MELPLSFPISAHFRVHLPFQTLCFILEGPFPLLFDLIFSLTSTFPSFKLLSQKPTSYHSMRRVFHATYMQSILVQTDGPESMN